MTRLHKPLPAVAAPARRSVRRPLATALLLCALVPAVAAFAADTVDVDVSNSTRIEGTIRPPDSRELFGVYAPRGATLTVTSKRRGPGELVPGFDVLDPGGGTIVSTPKRKGAKLRRVVLDTSGRYAIRVTGSGADDGDYRLKAKVKPRKKWRSELLTGIQPQPDGPADPDLWREFPFAAPSGALAKITVKSDVPDGAHVVALRHPDGSETPFDPPEAGAKKHVLTNVVLRRLGEYTLVIANNGVAPSTAKATVVVKPQPVEREDLDYRDGATGVEDGAQVYSRRVGPDGGVVTPEGVPGLEGVSLSVPPGALDEDVVLTINTAPDLADQTGGASGGPTVEFTQEGLEFNVPVEITLPYDPAAYTDPPTELEVHVRSGTTGEVSQVPPPYNINMQNATVAFEVDHFSSFQAIAFVRRPFEGDFVRLKLLHDATSQFGGSTTVGLGSLTVTATSPTTSQLALNVDDFQLTWDGGPSSGASSTRLTPVVNGTATTDGTESVDVVFATESFSGVRGRSDDALASVPSPGAAFPGSIEILLRRAAVNPTSITLSDTWHVAVLEYSAIESTPGQVALRHTVGQFELSVIGSGEVTALEASRRSSDSTLPGATWSQTTDPTVPSTGVLTPNGSDVDFDMAVGVDGRLDAMTLSSVVGGDVLVGSSFIQDGSLGSDGGAVRLVFFTRASTGLTVDALDGSSFVLQCAAVAPLPPDTGRILASQSEQQFGASGTGTVSGFAGLRREHDASGAVVDTTVGGTPSPRVYQVFADGIVETATVRGALEPSGGLVISTTRPDASGAYSLFIRLLR